MSAIWFLMATVKTATTTTNHPTGENKSELMVTKPDKIKDHKDGAPDPAVRTQTRKAGDPPACSDTSINFEARYIYVCSFWPPV